MLRCIVAEPPACRWTGGSERELIAHYLQCHQVPSASDYISVSDALRICQRDLERAQRMLAEERAASHGA